MKIALTVNYILDVEDVNDFYTSAKDGGRKSLESIDKELNDKFPKEIYLSEKVKGTRNCLSNIPLVENKNCVKCDCCGKYLSISKNVYLGLDYLTEVNGRTLCKSCEWEFRPESDFH